jgi:hypothetical protein
MNPVAGRLHGVSDMTGTTTEPSGLPHSLTPPGRGLEQEGDVRVAWGIRIRSARLRRQAALTADIPAQTSGSQAT